MTRLSALLGAGALLVGAFACHAPSDHEVPSLQLASSSPIASTSPVTSTRQTQEPLPAPSAPRAPLTEPPSFVAFRQEIDMKCPFDERDSSTAGMARAQIGVADCQAKIMNADAEKLTPAQRGALVDADPAGPHARTPPPPPSTPSLWAETIEAACNVEGGQTWLSGGTYMAGTMETLRGVGCLVGEDKALAFVMRSWANRRPEAVVAYVRWHESQRPPARAHVARWRRYAELARKTAPMEAGRDCRFQCRWSDADWIAFQRDLDFSEQSSDKLAKALCLQWPELATAFGGKATCEEEMSARWLPSTTGSDDGSVSLAADASADPPDASLGPPADPAFDRALLDTRRSWATQSGEAAGAARYLADAETALAASTFPELVRWSKRFATFRDRLAVADAQAQFMGVSSSTAGWLDDAHAPIGPTLRLLEGYLLRSVMSGAWQDLIGHIRARAAFGATVEAHLGKARDAFKRPCKSDGLRTCDGVTPQGFAKVAARLDWLLKESHALGEELCKATPRLRDELGRDCEKLTTHHLLSSAKYLGSASILEGW